MKQDYIISPMNYMGNKRKFLKDIIPKLPTNIDTFVDIFAGGFTVGINVNAKKIICNDIRYPLIDLYKYFQTHTYEDMHKKIQSRIEEYNLIARDKEAYNKLRTDYNNNNIDNQSILDMYVLMCYSYDNIMRFNSKQEFNTSVGKGAYNNRLANNLKIFSNALKEKDVEFATKDYKELDISLGHNDFIYFDPPYLISNPSYRDGTRGFSSWTEKDDKDLCSYLDNLTKQGIRWILSNVLEHKGRSNDFLKEWCKPYIIEDLEVKYCFATSRKDIPDTETQKTREVLILNYDVTSGKIL